MKNDTIKLIDLWYVDGNYGRPIKTKGFKKLVKKDTYYDEREGYIILDQSSNAYMIVYADAIFESEEEANREVRDQIKRHEGFARDQIKYYTKELEKAEQTLKKIQS